MSSAVNFNYGDYQFDPKPLFSVNAEPMKTPDGVGYGIMHTIQVNGDLILTGALQLDSGIVGVFDKIERLKNALNHDGRLLAISCNNSPIISGYPTIEGFSIDHAGDNYTQRATYEITFKMPTTILGTGNDVFNSSLFPPFIESCSETWDVEFADERMPFVWTLSDGTTEKFGYKVAVTHTVDVQARITYTGNEYSNIPWEDAKAYATGKLGFDSDFMTLTGVLGLPGKTTFSTYDVFNQYRQVSIDKTAGSIQIVETFIVSPSGSNSLPNNAIETFEISTSQDEGVITVNVEGEIEGLVDLTYTAGPGMGSFQVNSSKFSAASGYFNIIKDRIYSRALTSYNAISDTCFNRPLNGTIRSRTIATNPIDGTITYSYQYDTVPSGCITGECLISQNITIDDQLANDIFAEQVILGRAAGPILQDIGTTSARVRTVNIEIVTLPPTSCATVADLYAPVPTGQIENFISVISGDLGNNYSQVFVSANTQTWNFSIGRYAKSVSFVYNNCS